MAHYAPSHNNTHYPRAQATIARTASLFCTSCETTTHACRLATRLCCCNTVQITSGQITTSG